MRFENGAVVSIEGGLDAALIREYINSWRDPQGYEISHIGWGSHPRALWNAILFQDPLDIIGQDGRTATAIRCSRWERTRPSAARTPPAAIRILP